MEQSPPDKQKPPFQRRLFRAMQTLRDRLGREFEQQEFAAWVGKAAKGEPFSKGWVTQLLSRDEPPPIPVCLAIAKVCGVDPGWLAFGDESKAPAPGEGIIPLEIQSAAQDREARLDAALGALVRDVKAEVERKRELEGQAKKKA